MELQPQEFPTMAERLVVFTEGADGPRCGLAEEVIRRAGGSLLCTYARDDADRIRMAGRAEVLVAGNAPVTRGFLSALPLLKGGLWTGIVVYAMVMTAAI